MESAHLRAAARSQREAPLQPAFTGNDGEATAPRPSLQNRVVPMTPPAMEPGRLARIEERSRDALFAATDLDRLAAVRTLCRQDIPALLAEIERLKGEAEKAKAFLDAPKNCTEREVWRRNTAAWKILFDALKEDR